MYEAVSVAALRPRHDATDDPRRSYSRIQHNLTCVQSHIASPLIFVWPWSEFLEVAHSRGHPRQFQGRQLADVVACTKYDAGF